LEIAVSLLSENDDDVDDGYGQSAPIEKLRTALENLGG